MGISSYGWLRLIRCDDPHKKGCHCLFGPFMGENRTIRKAREKKWFHSESTGKFACPACVVSHKKLVKKHKGKLLQTVLPGDGVRAGFNYSDDFFDPFDVMMALMFADMILNDDGHEMPAEQFTGEGGEFGGAGASGSFDEQSLTAEADQDEERFRADPVPIDDPAESGSYEPEESGGYDDCDSGDCGGGGDD